MIPTYHCANYLRESLSSVLAQDLGPEKMHIEVVDDHSTRDDPEAVVRELSPNGRVLFYRQPANCGVTTNLNTCISRSRGELVHILHGDDLVLPGFYQEIDSLATTYPAAALYAVRSLFIDAEGVAFGLSADYSQHGPVALLPEFLQNLPFRTPAIVVRRSAYETLGGFNPTYPHAADIDMWLRAIQGGGGYLSRRVLVAYRMHQTSDTSRLAESAGNLQDIVRIYHKFAPHMPGLNHARFRTMLAEFAAGQAVAFQSAGKTEAARANWRFFWKMHGRIAGRIWLLKHQLNRHLADRLIRVFTPRLPPSI